MRAVGIIAEYNPFHNGHRWHVEQARKLSGCDYTVAVMSGNFVQRGEPAIFDKWSRAEMAVRGGVDLVVELPATFTVRSAQYFATGSIRLLQELGVVSHICFGVENENPETLASIAEQMDKPQTCVHLKNALKSGTTYAKVVETVLRDAQCEMNEMFLNKPNNILAVEYLRALRKYAPKIMPLMVKRRIAEHHERTITSSIASATAIRESIIIKGEMDPVTYPALPTASAIIIEKLLATGNGPVTINDLSGIMMANLRTGSPVVFANTADVSEGLHNKILSTSLSTNTVEELICQIVSKRYTRTRVQRIITQQLLGIRKKDTTCYDTTGPLYVRILAFNQKGRQILRQIRTNTTLPVITKTTNILNSRTRYLNNLTPAQKMLSIDTYATDIWSLAVPNIRSRLGGQDFLRSPVYIH